MSELLKPGVVERFWQHVPQRSPGECWEWTGERNQKGYGRFWMRTGTRVAHRVSYELLVGPMPAELVMDHLCRNRACVNPEHLEPVTTGENNRRGTRYIEQTHCKRGHEFTPENTHWDWSQGKKHRQCRACARLRYAAQEEGK